MKINGTKERWLPDFIAKINQDCIGAFSAQAAFFIIISFFPFLMLILSLSTLFNISEFVMEYFSVDLMPKAVQAMIQSIIKEVYSGGTGSMVSVTVLVTIWSASKGVMALMTGLNAVNGIPETRNYFYLRFLSMIYTLLFSFILIVVIVILVFGRSIYVWLSSDFPFMRDMLRQILSMRTTVAFIALTVFFWILFIFIPNRKTRAIAELPGAIVTTCGWIGFSYLFSYYIDNIGNYSYLYGSLTAIVLFMMWLWFCMFIFFIGAELNNLLQGRCHLKIICEDQYGTSYGEHYKVVHSPFYFVKRRREMRRMRQQQKLEEKILRQIETKINKK